MSLLKLKLVIFAALGLFYLKIWVSRIDFLGVVLRLRFFFSLYTGLIRRIKLASTNATVTMGCKYVICRLLFQKLRSTNYDNLYRYYRKERNKLYKSKHKHDTKILKVLGSNDG